MPERFPPPWVVEPLPECWVVKDANNFPITWFHFATDKLIGTRADRMTRAQAYAMAVNFARLPELLRSEKGR
jgi:hypothetical protein